MKVIRSVHKCKWGAHSPNIPKSSSDRRCMQSFHMFNLLTREEAPLFWSCEHWRFTKRFKTYGQTASTYFQFHHQFAFLWGKLQTEREKSVDLFGFTPPSKRKMVIFITRISGDPGDLKPCVPPDQIPSVSSSNGRPTCSQNSRALKLADLGGCSPIPPGSESSHGRYTKPRVALSCTSFVNETKHICMRYGTILSWIPSTNSWVIIVFFPEPFPSSDVGRPAIHCITWGPTTIHCTILYYPTLPFTSFDYMTTGQCIASHYLTLNRISCIASHDITAPYLKQPRKKKTKTKRILHSLYKKQLCSFVFFGKNGEKKQIHFP